MKTLLKFSEFYEEIMQENGRLYKLSILDNYKEDEDVRYCLNFLFNPYITTGISDKKYMKEFSGTCVNYTQISSFKDLLEYIKNHNTGSSVDVLIAQSFIKIHQSDIETGAEDYRIVQEVYRGLITKNLPLGIDVKTINKVMPNLIPTFNVMLANKYFDNPKIVEGKKFALTTKIDGGRIIAIKKNGEAKFYTRQGQEYEGLVDLKEEMEKYFPDNICLDGEITLLDPYERSDSLFEDVQPRKLSSKEQYQATMKITRKDGEKHGVKMLVFDYLLASEFESQKCDRPYHSRRNNLQNLYARFELVDKHTMKYFDLLPILYIGEDTNKITEWLNRNIENDEEGVMINILDAPYEFKRTNNLLKVKKMHDMDLEVIGFEEGSNKYSGTLGAFLVDYKGYTLKVGSGMSDVLRDEIWANRDEWLGRTIVVQYFEETQNQNGGLSLRFPVYLDWRNDK